ncbi:MAG: toprim domain-containing protein [Patescibacteria group bacterium UBA2163]
MSHPIDEITELIARMPGIGPRQARRIVQFLLRSDASYKQKLTSAISRIADHISQCKQCFRFDEVDTDQVCTLCADTQRDPTLLMVVEKDVDIESIEQAGIYNGYYFVLGSLIPLAKQRKNIIEPRTHLLEKRLGNSQINEVILAFATTPEGDFTARELSTLLKERTPHIHTSMLGRGLSLGAEIEYADQDTLRNAFDGRH